MQIEKRPNGKYRVRVWDQALGRRLNVGTFRTKADATLAGHQAELEMRTVGAVEQRRDITLGELCERYLASNSQLVHTTCDWYRHGLKKARSYFGDKASVRRLSRETVQGYVASLVESGLAPTSVNGYTKALGAVLEQACEWGYRSDNPAHRVRNLPTNKRRDGAIRVVTPAEHKRLVDAAPAEYRVMFSIWPFIGLRRSELQGLTWSCVDLDSRTLEVRCQLREDGTLDPVLKTPKSARTVHLTRCVVNELRAWKLASLPNALDLVFPTKQGRPQRSASHFYKVWNRTCDAAGLEGLNPHDMRHAFATWNLAAGENVKWVAEQMGHEKPSITLDTYAHLLPGDSSRVVHRVEEWYDALPAGDGQPGWSAPILPHAAGNDR